MTQISMLGPMQVVSGQDLVHVGGRKQRAVLAMLALRVNQVVSMDFIIDGLWGEGPGGAVNTVHVYVSRLRGLQNPAAGDRLLPILRRGSGYLLDLNPDTIDTAVFDRLVLGRFGCRDHRSCACGRPAAGCTGPVAR